MPPTAPRAPLPRKSKRIDECFIKAAAAYFASSVHVSRNAVAATRLQRVWRGSFGSKRLYVLAGQFLTPGVGLPGTYVRTSGFPVISAFIKRQAVIDLVSKLLGRVLMLCTRRHGHPPGGSDGSLRLSAFMTGFVVAIYPGNCFEGSGAPERELLESSSQLYVRFERIAKVLAQNRGGFKSLPPSLTEDFIPMLLNFFHRFDACKRPEPQDMALRLACALDGLYDTKDAVMDSADSRCVLLRLAVEDQIGMLRTRLIELGGLRGLIRYDEKRRQKMAEKARKAAALE